MLCLPWGSSGHPVTGDKSGPASVLPWGRNVALGLRDRTMEGLQLSVPCQWLLYSPGSVFRSVRRSWEQGLASVRGSFYMVMTWWGGGSTLAPTH